MNDKITRGMGQKIALWLKIESTTSVDVESFGSGLFLFNHSLYDCDFNQLTALQKYVNELPNYL